MANSVKIPIGTKDGYTFGSDQLTIYDNDYDSSGLLDVKAAKNLISTSTPSSSTIRNYIPKYTTISKVLLNFSLEKIYSTTEDYNYYVGVAKASKSDDGYTYGSYISYTTCSKGSTTFDPFSLTVSSTGSGFYSATSNAGQISNSAIYGIYVKSTETLGRDARAFKITNINVEYQVTYPKFTIGINNNNFGSVTTNTQEIWGSTQFEGTTINKTFQPIAIPNNGYRFVKWVRSDGTSLSTDRKKIFKEENLIGSNTVITAEFTPITKITYLGAHLSTSNFNSFGVKDGIYPYYDKYGGVTISGGEYSQSSTDQKTAIRLPNLTKAGYTFHGWSTKNDTDINGAQLNYDIIVNENGGELKLYAVFIPNKIPVSLEIEPLEAATGCTIFLEVDGITNPYQYGDSNIEVLCDKPITASLNVNQTHAWEMVRLTQYNYQNGQWVAQNPNDIKHSISTTMPSDSVKFKGEFRLRKYLITPSASNPNKVTFEYNGKRVNERTETEILEGYDYGSEVVISVFPHYGYLFNGWQDGNKNSVRTFTINGTMTPGVNIIPVELPNLTDTQVADNIIERDIISYSKKKIKNFGDYSFYNCKNLTFAEISLDEESKTDNNILPFQKNIAIGKNAFFGCDKLTYLKLPPTCTTIEQGAFSNCSNLNCLIIPSEKPINLTVDPELLFSGTQIKPNGYGRIFVPEKQIDAYLQSNWEIYEDIIKPIVENQDICQEEDI